MSSSLQQKRSLRKPAKPLLPEPTASTTNSSRSESPSRLPVKPSTRPISTLVCAPLSTTSSTSSHRTRPVSTVVGRSTSPSRKRDPVPESITKERRYPPLTTTNRPTTTRPRPISAGVTTAPPARIPSKHTRAKSTVTAAPPLRPPSCDADSKPVRPRSASADKSLTPLPTKPRLRPAFSALQQHYSPAKVRAPKPLTSAILAPPSPSKLPANIAASAETSRLQAELLQLHLLHRDARPTYNKWQCSTKEKLGKRFHEISQVHKIAAEKEASVVESDNIMALRRWAQGRNRNIEERIQVLDEVMTDLWLLSEPGGRYARIVRRFERYIGSVSDAEEARERGGTDHNVLFVGALDNAWKEDVWKFTRRLEGWKEKFDGICDFKGEEGSSLGRMLDGGREMIGGMLEELYTMEELERGAVEREDRWVERMIREGTDENAGAGAVWRVF